MARKEYLDPQKILQDMKEICEDAGESSLVVFTEDIAEHYEVHPSTAWRKLQALEDMGHIKRLRRRGTYVYRLPTQ